MTQMTSSIGNVSKNHPFAVANKTEKKEEDSYFERIPKAITEFFGSTSGIKNTLKTIKYTLDWTKIGFEQAGKKIPSKAARIGEMAGGAKDLISGLEVPSKALQTVEKIKDICNSKSLRESIEKIPSLISPVTAMVSNACDFVVRLHKENFVSLGQRGVSAANGVNCGSAVIGSTYESYKQIQNIEKAAHEMKTTQVEQKKISESKKQNLAYIKLATALTYIFVGSVGLSSLIIGFAVAPWVFLLPLTGALILTIVSFFYDKIERVSEVSK